MSCNTCQTKFSFFTRENSCPHCGLSYCSKCLKYKCRRTDAAEAIKVCGPCYNKSLSSDKMDSEGSSEDALTCRSVEKLAPIDITSKLESLIDPAKPPIVMYTHSVSQNSTRWDALKKGLEPADQEIVDRLRKLKGEDKMMPLPTVEEIQRRLALLKDQDPDANKADVYRVDTRTDQQKTNDLMQEYLERLELTADPDRCSDIQKRMHKLQHDDGVPQRKYNEEIDDDKTTVTQKIIKKALAEAVLEGKYGDTDEVDDMEVEAATVSEDEEDKFQCVMCDQTVDLVRCLGCSGDLYCALCFEDNHDDFEMGSHRKVPFKPPKKHSSHRLH